MLKSFKNMEVELNKDHNKLESKNTAPSHDLLHIGVDSS